MNQRTVRIYALSFMSVLLLGFQNCAKVNTSDLADDSSGKLVGDGINPHNDDGSPDNGGPIGDGSQPNSTVPPTSSTNTPAPGDGPSSSNPPGSSTEMPPAASLPPGTNNPDDPRYQPDSREILCQSMKPGVVSPIAGAPVAPATMKGGTPVSMFSQQNLTADIELKAGVISQISSVSTSKNISLSAGLIDSVSSLSGYDIDIAAGSIDSISSLSGHDIGIAVGSIDSISSLSSHSLEISAGSIRSVSSLSSSKSIEIVAGAIDSINSISSGNSASINANSIKKLNSFSVKQVEAVTHVLGEAASGSSGDFCLSAQKIGQINSFSGRLSLYGRNEGGQRATVENINSVSGFISLYDVDVKGSMTSQSVNGKFVNTHVPKLESASGELILVDSVIDEVTSFSGTIILKGNSKVLKSDGSAKIISN